MKLIPTSIGLAVAAGSLFAQGTVRFDNNVFSIQKDQNVDTPFYDTRGFFLNGPEYLAQLYIWDESSGFKPVGNATPFVAAGYFDGGVVALQGVFGNAPVWIQVRAWQQDGGTSFEAAARVGVWSGSSGVLQVFAGCPYCAPPTIPARLIGLTYPGSPLIVQQPQSRTIQPGSPVTVSVIASSGVLMDYQWYQQPGSRPDGLIPGATNAAYTPAALLTNTTFWVSAGNSAGTTLSDQATVTVLPSAPQLSLEQVAGLPVLTLTGVTGVTYRIEYSTNLSTSDWISLVELSLSTSPFTFTDSTGSNSSVRYYRALAP